MMRVNYLRGILGLIGLVLIAVACATPKSELSKEVPAHYIQKASKMETAPGSLWSDSVGLFADRRARGLNDLVTINIVESSSASKQAETDSSRQSSMDNSITSFFGNSLTYDLNALFGPGIAGTLSPKLSASTKNDFTGKGTTTRQGTFTATISARIIEVMPNGNFLIESRKDITVNREKQVLLLRGLIRPDDIAKDNTVSSTKVSNAEMIYTGDGVLNDKQHPGWLTRVVDWVWPF